MAKAKVTRKWLNDNYNCIAVYDVQYLFQSCDAVFYTCGVYGWNFDAWLITDRRGNQYCINAGYRSLITNCSTCHSYEIDRRYNMAASKLSSGCRDYTQYLQRLKELQLDYMDEILGIDG